MDSIPHEHVPTFSRERLLACGRILLSDRQADSLQDTQQIGLSWSQSNRTTGTDKSIRKLETQLTAPYMRHRRVTSLYRHASCLIAEHVDCSCTFNLSVNPRWWTRRREHNLPDPRIPLGTSKRSCSATIRVAGVAQVATYFSLRAQQDKG